MSILAKIVLLGDGGVGKTALRQSYMGKGFQAKYVMTIGADFSVKEELIGDRTWKFQIWDLAGQPRFEAVRTLYYVGCVGAILVYDVTRPDSLMNLKNWIHELHNNSNRNNVPLTIVGNKIDIRREGESLHITEEQGCEYIKRLKEELKDTKNIVFVEASAKTGLNVPDVFIKLGEAIADLGKKS